MCKKKKKLGENFFATEGGDAPLSVGNSCQPYSAYSRNRAFISMIILVVEAFL
jgi:hypothetical protein